jgi:sugar phosphate permease
MAAVNYNHIVGLFCIIIGIVIIAVALGDLLVRVIVALAALSLINYGLRLRGLPPLQLLIPLLASRSGRGRWFNQWR